MIYVCIPAYNESRTVGVLLWKIRQVFTEFPREYHLLVTDDASDDSTADVLAPYTRVLPLTVVRHTERWGYAATVEELVKMALDRTDRPKRDYAIIMHSDFVHDPAHIPELVRRLESGCDIVVAEDTTGYRRLPIGERLARRSAPLCLRRPVGIPNVRDVASGFCGYRLVTLKAALGGASRGFLSSDSWCTSAELLFRCHRHARRVDVVPTQARYDMRQRPSRSSPLARIRAVLRVRSGLEGTVA